MSNKNAFSPFINGLKEYPEKKQKDVAELRKWYDKQAYLPTIHDDYLLLFLHACYYNQDKAKRAIEQYFTIRTNTPALFGDRDPQLPNMQIVFEYGNLVALQKKTSKNYHVLLYSVFNPEVKHFVFAEAIKAFCMFNDWCISQDGLSDGYIILFDMKGVTVGHFARVTLPALRAYMQYIQDAHPARLKEIHVMNTAAFINHVMRLIQPLIQSDLLNILKFHRGLPPTEDVPTELFPNEYGGSAGPLRELHDKCRQQYCNSPVREWLMESGEALKCDNSKRPKKKSWGFFSGPDID